MRNIILNSENCSIKSKIKLVSWIQTNINIIRSVAVWRASGLRTRRGIEFLCTDVKTGHLSTNAQIRVPKYYFCANFTFELNRITTLSYPNYLFSDGKFTDNFNISLKIDHVNIFIDNLQKQQ